MCEVESPLIFHLDYTSGESRFTHMGRLSNLPIPLISSVLLSFQLSPCRLAFTLAKAMWCANQLSGSWQRIWIHSGVPLTSLFSYHWASRTQREQEALDPGDLSLLPGTTRTCFYRTIVLVLVQRMTSWEGGRQGLHGQMVIRSNNEYLQVSDKCILP